MATPLTYDPEPATMKSGDGVMFAPNVSRTDESATAAGLGAGLGAGAGVVGADAGVELDVVAGDLVGVGVLFLSVVVVTLATT